jgi:hypothetical protein
MSVKMISVTHIGVKANLTKSSSKSGLDRLAFSDSEFDFWNLWIYFLDIW